MFPSLIVIFVKLILIVNVLSKGPVTPEPIWLAGTIPEHKFVDFRGSVLVRPRNGITSVSTVAHRQHIFSRTLAEHRRQNWQRQGTVEDLYVTCLKFS